MGLFGDRDLKVFKRELTMLRMAFQSMHRARDEAQFMSGVTSATYDITMAGRRLQAKGQRSTVEEMLNEPPPSNLTEEAQQMFGGCIAMIREGLDRPESDFARG